MRDYVLIGVPEGMGVYDLRMLVEMQNELFKSLEPYFRMLGLKLYVDRIVLYPEGCGDRCVEYVWRIECDSVEVCEEIRKKIREQQSGVEVGGGEEEA